MGVGVVVAQGSATSVEGVLVEISGPVELVQQVQVEGEVVGRLERLGMIAA